MTANVDCYKTAPSLLRGQISTGQIVSSIWSNLNCYQLFQSIWSNHCRFRPGLLVGMQTSTATDLLLDLLHLARLFVLEHCPEFTPDAVPIHKDIFVKERMRKALLEKYILRESQNGS